tara:strand:+ start:154 stop:4722 length:4569 start_codon:yes stop_codon:yes gene_type:complete
MSTQKSRNIFVEELCKYFMDFLQTGFKSTRFPKRYIRLNNEKNFKIGIDLSKYENFNESIRKVLNKPEPFQQEISVKKGTYTVKLNNTSIDLLKKLTKQIKDKDVEKIVLLSTKTIKEFALSHRNKPDEAYDKINEIIKKEITEIIVKPISEKMDPLIGSQSNFVFESLYTLEMGLTELILDPLIEQIPSIFNNILADKKYKPKDDISSLFNRSDIASSLLNYFSNFEVKDFYYDLQEIVNSQKNLDKKEIYLYFGDIEIEKKGFPLFYTQVNIKEYSTESHFKIGFSNEMFVNKKAIQYAFQVLFKEDKKVETFNEERKLYISEEENLSERLTGIIQNLISKLRTDGNIDLKNPSRQISKSLEFKISNNCYFCVFDKSDEALINDYEDILSKILAGDSEVAAMFKQLITDFLINEPEVVNENIEDEWDGLEVNDRLNYESPIPVNPEQQKILRALNNEKCKYVVVEGPPGTGKSHTISAIAFDYILKFKSILILSDTREALDVVENKINTTLNQVRGKHNIQNPILRLGKMGNTYNKILAKSSVDNLRTFHRAQKTHRKDVENEITEISGVVNDRLKILSDHYKSIDKSKFEEFAEVSKQCSKEDLVIDVKNFNLFLQKNSLTSEDLSLDKFIDNLNQISEYEFVVDQFKEIYKSKKLSDFNNYLQNLKLIDEYAEHGEANINLFYQYGNISEDTIGFLKSKVMEYRKLTDGIFGGFLKGNQIIKIEKEIEKKLKPKKNIDLKKNDESLLFFSKHASDFFNFCSKKNVDYKTLLKIIKNNNPSSIFDQTEFIEKYKYTLEIIFENQEQLKKLDIKENDIETLFENKLALLEDETVDSIKKYYNLENFFSGIFDNSENFDYATLMKRAQALYTTRMTDIIDEKIINFYDTNKNTAKSLSKIIRAKQKFPKEQFSKLKNTFPCIISSVRDFAEYIDLDIGMFDLIIIDEASQVSIAQAFPAIIRARKILVLGDKKQFSNLQSYQATSIKNNALLNNLRKVFKNNISKDPVQLERLESFNVKTSILDFFERIANYAAMLKKHFRGYPEHIAYCSKTFYGNDLQAIRLRSKSIKDIIHFEILDYEIDKEVGNTNDQEAKYIIKQLEKLKESGAETTVGIITPFSDQQKNLTTLITKHKDKEYFFEKLHLKIMTFDTCQGEEREIIYYSMVATKNIDKLNWIFPTDLSRTDLEELGDKKAQRLNVGLSRVQEKMVFVLSKKPDDFNKEIGNAIRFIHNIFDSEEKLPKAKQLDPKSPMEVKVLQWFKQTSFYLENKDKIEVKSQFPIGEYFKQLYMEYNHPKFVVDFLVIYNSDGKTKQSVIEYDGLKDHFENTDLITDSNYEDYYTVEHEERQKILETYGVNFIRLNRFNISDNPIKYLDQKLKETFKKNGKINTSQYKIQESIQKTNEGEKKYCDRCKKLKDLKSFKDKSLSSGIGIVCMSCKKNTSGKRRSVPARQEYKTTNVKFKWQADKIYNIDYTAASGYQTSRKIKIISIDTKYLRTYDYKTGENRTFRKDRVQNSKEA